MQNNDRILIIYIEPTPYIISLIKNLIQTFHGSIHVLFLDENRSQNWNINYCDQFQCEFLPKSKYKKFYFLVKKLLKNKYGLIHVAGWGEPIFLFLILIAKLSRIPVVMESDTPIPHQAPRWKRIIKRLIYPSLFKLVNLFLPGGTRQAKYIEYYGVPSRFIIPVQMTVDVSSIIKYTASFADTSRNFFRKRDGIDEQATVFLFMGRLEVYKGLIDLISAFHLIQNNNIVLLIVGDGSLRQYVEDNVKINKNIRYVGRRVDKEVIESYYLSDVLVLPSHFEPWGLVVNEAMAVGKPVLVSDRVGCIDDLIVPYKTGLITKAQSIDELQSAIEWMTDNLEKRMMMGNNAKKLMANWTLENEARNICKAWRQAVYDF